ncbi:MAG: putative porin [Bacteroidota bacterium]
MGAKTYRLDWLSLGLLLFGALMCPHLSWGQFPVNTGQDRFSSTGGFGAPGNSSSSQFGQAPRGFGPDSTGADSFYNQVPDIIPETRWVEPSALFNHQDFRPIAKPALEQVYTWDPMQQIPGFVQSLGQVGKPYQVWVEGAAERFYDLNLYQDQIFNRYDRNIVGPLSGVRYYDTRTPFVDVQYLQGPDKLLLTDVTASQNITPFWNMSLAVKRHLSEGAYRNFVTDQTAFWISSNYRSKSRRYYLFANLTLNALNNQIHGGSPRAEGQFRFNGEFYRDSLPFYNLSFFKGFSSPNLSDANLNRNVRGAVVDQYYHLIGHPDSSGQHRLTLRGLIDLEQNFRSFDDQSISLSTPSFVPIYPTRDPDTNAFSADFTAWQGRAAAEGTYSWTPREGFRVHVDGGISYQLINWRSDTSLITNQNITDQYVSGELRIPWIAVGAHLRQRVSSRFSPQREIGAEAWLYPLVKKGSADTASSPLQVFANLDLDDLNPSLFQGYFAGDSGNIFQPNPNLDNQLRFYAGGGLGLRETFPVRRGDTLLPMYLRVKAFYQRFDRQIYYDSALQVRQAPAGEPMQWIGATVSGRLRMWRHVFLENFTQIQLGTVNSQVPSRQWQAQSLPLVSGKLSLYFDHRQVSWAEEARIGVDVFYHTPYLGQTLDPWSGEYFPTNYQLYPYARVDAFAAVRLMGVYVFLRYQHVNELLPLAGYYTTPFYPMLERAFTLGIRWQFFN